MTLGKVLVVELVPVDGLSTSSVVVGEVSSLEHAIKWIRIKISCALLQLRDDAVEAGSGVSETRFSGAQLAEVLSALRSDILVQLEGDSSRRGSVNGDVKVYSRVAHGILTLSQ